MVVRPRVGLPAAILLLAAVVVLAHYVQVWAVVPPQGTRTSDYAGTFAASTLWRTGHGAAMYDVTAQEAVSRAAGVPSNHLFIPFENPPLAAVIAAPVSLVDATAAYRVWSLIQVAVLVGAIAVVSRVAPWPSRRPRLSVLACCAVALAGFGTGLLLVEGQWDAVPALGAGIAYAGWRQGRRAVPGFVAGFAFAVAKPHLAAGLVAFMIGRRDWRGLAGAASGAAAVAVAGVVVAGPAASAGFVNALLQPVNSPPAQMQGATGLIGALLGGGIAPYALALGLAGVATIAAGWLGAAARRHPALLEPAFLGAMALSLWAAPHLLGHDLVVLAPALVAALAWSMDREIAARGSWPGAASFVLVGGWVALSLASATDLGQGWVGAPGRLTPWVLLAAAVAIVLVIARRAPAAAARPLGVSRPAGPRGPA